jgi:hypothetical protein
MRDGDEILEAIRTVDETTLRFSPWGFGGRAAPADSARFLDELLTYATLSADVPESIRLNFERVRTLFRHGLLEYSFFSVAYELSHFVLEGALRHRFVSYYVNEIPIWKDGEESAIGASGFDDYYEALSRLRADRHEVRLREVKREGLPSKYPDLYSWARRRNLLVGQRNIGVFGSLVRLRNYVAHPVQHTVRMPPQVIDQLRDVAEIINRLWGFDTEGGRLFPGPVRRRPRVAALSSNCDATLVYSSLSAVRTDNDHRDWTYAVFLAADGEELVDFDWAAPGRQRFLHTPGLEMTRYPAECLWGPAGHEQLLRVIDGFNDEDSADEVEFLDRTFYIRGGDAEGRPEFPRTASQVVESGLSDPTAEWHVVRADYPMDAWVLVRDNRASQPKHVVGDVKAIRLASRELREKVRP